jgi:hypothetical protein
MRTLCSISENLRPIDKVLDEQFLPALLGCDITTADRELLSIRQRRWLRDTHNLYDNSDTSHRTSRKITTPLIKRIKAQSDELPDKDEVKKARSTTMEKVHSDQQKNIESIKMKQTEDLQRKLEEFSEPGASSWLGALPLRQYGFDLGKGEFHDALSLRYNKSPKNIPSRCPCGAQFTVTHALDCHKGGFVNARHDNVRDLEAQLMKSVCQDVEIEAPLQKVVNKRGYGGTAILTDEARLDIRTRGFWRRGQNAFFDVCITNASCNSQRNTAVKSVLRSHELKKKRHYNQRVIQIEHGTLTPLIFTTSGAMGHECQKFHKTLADKISKKNGDKYEDVMRYMRVKVSFLVLKATLLCLRGSRSFKVV